jgi:hypothetical protein
LGGGGGGGVEPIDKFQKNIPIPHWPLPAVRDLTRDGRLSTDDESVLKLSVINSRLVSKPIFINLLLD